MAESAVEESGKKSNKLVIIMIGFAVILLGAGGAWFFLLQEAPAVAEEIIEQPKATKIYTVRLGNTGKPPYFVTYLPTENSDSIFMEIHIQASTRDRDVKYALQEHMPLIVSRLSSLFLQQTVTNMRTLEGRKELHAEVTKIVKQIMQDELGTPGIDDILFLEFVMS